jgi:SAM-dependent methyltransferase
MPDAMPDAMPDPPAPYGLPDIGLLYDALRGYQERADVAFYVEEAARARGPVLEVGCGTGRILLPTARAGATIVGVDASTAMLARCRERLAAEPEAVRARVSLHHADARALDLGATFALVTAPFRVLQHLVTVDDQLRCLTSVARHLAPPGRGRGQAGGRFVFDVFNPHYPAMVADRSAESEDTAETALPDGRTLRRTVRVPRVRWTEQVSEIELIYYVAERAGAPPARHVQAFDMRWYVPAELVHLLARAGLRVEAVYGAFDRSPLTDASPEQVVCAVRA